jgi:hypothetical protein
VIATAFLLIVAASGQSDRSKAPTDDMNPRAPSTPLEITFQPYWCTRCAKEGLLKGKQPQTIEMERKPVDDLVKQLEIKTDWIAMQTPHFKIFSTLEGSMAKYADSVFCRRDLERLKTIMPKISFGPDGVVLDEHERVHLYQIRLEREYAHFAALTNNTKPNLGMPMPYEIYLWADYSQHHVFCDRYVGGRSDKSGVQHHDRTKPNFILFSCAESIVSANNGKGDGPLANHVFHNVAHCMIDGYNDYFRETPAWLEEGLGHYYERRENPRWNNFCWAEGKMPTEFQKPDWETTIFSLVRRDKDPPFAQWCEKLQPGELTGVENGFTWGIVKWLVETEPLRFTKMIEPMDDLTLNLDTNGLIQQAFGCSPSVLYQRWREYALANYVGK